MERNPQQAPLHPGIRRIPYPEATDEQLVLASLLGDLPAFDELIRRYRTAVTLTVEPLVGNRPAAEDAAQEIFLLAFKALPQLEEPERFSAWLRAIAKRRAIRISERERRTEPAEMPRLDVLLCRNSQELGRTDPAHAYAEKSKHESFWRAIDGLPAEYREVLLLRGREDWSVLQIADFLGLTEATIRGRLFRARAALRQALTETETTSGEAGEANVPDERKQHSLQRQRPERGYQRTAAGTPTSKADVPVGGTCQYDRLA